MKTPIRWAGSKKALLPALKRHWDHNPSARYIEPFCGSACLFFALEPREAILSDLNWELITTYRTLRSHSSRVIECIRRYPPTETHYYVLRQVDPESLSDVEIAARFLFLNKLCFNGIYRTNLAGEFNVPYGKPKGRVNFDFDTLVETATLLKNTELLHGDFELVLAHARAGDFVYLDPPYAVAKRRVFSEYQARGFSERDLDRLRASLLELDRRGVHFVLSYADSSEGRKLAADWNYRRVRTRRNVAGFAGSRRHAFEVMASNRGLRDGD
jgi:DNA adenine methylase